MLCLSHVYLSSHLHPKKVVLEQKTGSRFKFLLKLQQASKKHQIKMIPKKEQKHQPRLDLHVFDIWCFPFYSIGKLIIETGEVKNNDQYKIDTSCSSMIDILRLMLITNRSDG